MACGVRPQPQRPDLGAAPAPPPGGGPLLRTRAGILALGHPLLVGVLNATPDSFSDGGRYLDPVQAADAAVEMVARGAGMLDLGAESTRPGAAVVPDEEELRRLLPVLRAVRAAVRVPLSVDTRKSTVARAALASGADVVNDVSAGRHDRDMFPLCSSERVPVVLTHMQGTPTTMQVAPAYGDVVEEVRAFLAERARAAERVGIHPDAIIVDPGIGFGKTVDHNRRLLHRLPSLSALGYPLMVGVSRKQFIGQLLGGRAPGERLWGTAAAVALAVANGAHLLRVHDVAAMCDVATVADRLAQP